MKSKQILVSIFSILSVSLYPCLFMYFYNLGKVEGKEVIGISVIIVLAAIVLLEGLFLIFKNIGKAVLMTNIIMVFILYFALIEKAITRIFPMLYYWHVVLICLFILVHIIYFIHKIITPKIADQFNQGLLIIFTGLILYNGLIKIPQAIKDISYEKQKESQALVVQDNFGGSTENKVFPNVYYFIFDEYAGYDGILRYCDYDNIDFYNTLEELGFVTSKHSINGSVDTFTEIPNLLQLQKVNTLDMPMNKKKENFKDPYLLILMKEYGYSINIDSPNYEILDHSYADYQFTTDFVSTFRTFNSYVIKNTALYPFYGYMDQDNEINVINKTFDYGEESTRLSASNLFTIGYFNFPHLPYIVDENGNKTSDSDRVKLSDPVPYLGQFKYANKKILELVNGIIKNDPNSIIILQSDHGFRLPSHLHFWYGIDTYDLKVEAKYEQNILNAVYYQGEKVNIEGLSGLNTLYIVLNKLLGTNFEFVQ